MLRCDRLQRKRKNNALPFVALFNDCFGAPARASAKKKEEAEDEETGQFETNNGKIINRSTLKLCLLSSSYTEYGEASEA